MSGTFDELLALAERLGLTVRHAKLGGNGGGLAKLRGERFLFVDLEADAADQLEQTAKGLAKVEGLERIFVRPDVRELLEGHQV